MYFGANGDGVFFMSDSVFLVRAQTSSFFQHAMLRIIKFNFFNAESEESGLLDSSGDEIAAMS